MIKKESFTNNRITIVSIAKEMGISPSTVSRAFDPSSRISDEVREKILAYAEKTGYVPNRAASRLSMREIKVGVSMNYSYAPGAQELMRGIKDAYSHLYDYKLALKTATFTEENDFLHGLDELECCDCLIISGVPASCIDRVNKIASVKPVVLLQSNHPDINCLFTSTLDSITSAQMAADFLACCLRDSRKVILFTGNRNSYLHQKAAEAFAECCEQLGLELVASYDMNDDPDTLAKMADAITDYPDGIYITSGQSLELCKRVNSLKKKPILVTFDIYPELNAYLRNGTVAATLYQDQYRQGFNALDLLIRSMVDSTVPPKVYTPIPQLVLPSALKYYLDSVPYDKK